MLIEENVVLVQPLLKNAFFARQWRDTIFKKHVVVWRVIHNNDRVIRYVWQQLCDKPFGEIIFIHGPMIITRPSMCLKNKLGIIYPSIFCDCVQDNKTFTFPRRFGNRGSKGSIKSGIIFPIATVPCGICTTVVFMNERVIKIHQCPLALVAYFLLNKVGSAGFDHIVSFTKRGMPLHKTMENMPLRQTASSCLSCHNDFVFVMKNANKQSQAQMLSTNIMRTDDILTNCFDIFIDRICSRAFFHRRREAVVTVVFCHNAPHSDLRKIRG